GSIKFQEISAVVLAKASYCLNKYLAIPSTIAGIECEFVCAVQYADQWMARKHANTFLRAPTALPASFISSPPFPHPPDSSTSFCLGKCKSIDYFMKTA
ncbi:MAG TPA: hypothetical protein VJ577_10275, partial [Burkholderiaceae bacterium]|nr:hypothetical protein [Burkholderiaceae bacterium]